MFFHFNLIEGNCTRNSDEGPGNKNSEFYWTWMVYSEKNQQISDLYQGFSLGCSLDSGYGFNDVDQQTRKLNDPKFTIELPEVTEGETKKINFDLYCWESDKSSIIVKKTFTNQAAQKLWTISEQVEQQKQETQDQFFDWLEKSDNNFLENLVSTGVMTSGPIAIAQAAVPLVKGIIKAVEDNSDDFIGISQATLFINKVAGKLRYRWLFDDGIEHWIEGEQEPFQRNYVFTSDDGDNSLETSLLYQLVDVDPLQTVN